MYIKEQAKARGSESPSGCLFVNTIIFNHSVPLSLRHLPLESQEIQGL